MKESDIVRTVTIRHKSEGAAQVQSDLKGLAAAQDQVAASSSRLASISETSARRQISAAAAFERTERMVNPAAKALYEFERIQRTVNTAVAQNPALQERANSVMQAAADRYAKAQSSGAVANDNFTKSAGLARHELINLSRQAQDVAVSLAGGQSPLTVLFQQGSQIGDVFASSQGTFSGFFKQVTSSLGSFLTVGRVAFGGVALAITGAGIALSSYLDSQQKVQMSLLGSGRASGASLSDINSIARSGSSLTGFSVSEARAFAAELASVGKIGKENLEPLVKIGHDFATVYGIDAAEAAKLLAKSFSDPVAGADQLNQRLGFLDAATKNLIHDLVAQNRIQEAQRVLQAGVASSLADVSQAVATSTKFWTALGNIASNVWDAIGAAAARATGIGLKLGLEEQIENAKKRITELEAIAARRSDAVNKALGTADLLTKEREKLENLTASYSHYGQAAQEAQQRAQSFAQAQGVKAQIPEIEQAEKLRNENELLVRTMIDVQTTGGQQSEILKRAGVTYEQLAQAVANSTSKVKNFKTEFEQAIQAQQVQSAALTAFSPSAKGDIAFQQRLNAELARETELTRAQTLAEGDRAIAVKGVQVALSEAARTRALAAKQSVDSAQLDIDLIGQSVGKQAELRANLQARQALEQQASQNRTAFDEVEFARLQKINAELGKRKQIEAERAAQSQANFARDTVFLSDTEKQIAAVNFQLHANKWKDFMNDGLSSTLRMTAAVDDLFKTGKSSATSFTNDLISGLGQGQKATEALHGAFKNLASTLTSSALKSLFEGDFISAGIKGIAAIGAAIFSANTSSSGEKWLKEQTEGMNARMAEIQQRQAAVGVDMQTRQGAFLALDQKFTQERLAENKAGGQDMQALLEIQRREYNALAKEWDQKDLDQAKAAADAKLAVEKAANDRALGFQNRLFAAANDNATLEGQLAAFDRAAQQERAREVEDNGKAIVDLEAAQAAERLGVIKKYNDQITEAAEQAAKAQLDAVNGIGRSVTDYLNNLISGPGSTSSPTATLSNAQSVYNANLALAISGNADAQSKFPQLADNLEKAARAVYASSQQYQDIKSQIITQGLALPAVQNATDPVVIAIRDTISAINAAAATQALDATLQGLIKSAIDAGNAQQIAALLVPKFDALNTTADQGLDFAEFVRGLGPQYAGLATDTKVGSLLTDTQLRAAGINVTGPLTRDQIAALGLSQEQGNVLNVYRSIAGSDSLISRTDLIASATGATKNNTDASVYLDTLAYSNARSTDANTANSALQATIGNQLLQTSIQQLNLLNSALNPSANPVPITYTASGAFTSSPTIDHAAANAQALVLLQKIVVNTWATAQNTGLAIVPNAAPATHAAAGTLATGGVIPAYGLALVSEHSPGGGRFLRAGPEPITVSPYAPVPPFRAGNDNAGNAALVSELRELRKEVERLQKIVAAGSNGIIQTTYEAGEKGATATKESGRDLRAEMRLRKRDQRAA